MHIDKQKGKFHIEVLIANAKRLHWEFTIILTRQLEMKS